ncbi:hypothetical protein L596_002203 [Steinernema carpocapsae]|uniref:Reverse transcriptase domain-containing protein n=1 Tax=Steinernema carpocapsae TaxID=34508 RepID=A0A4U8UPK3_STECR|nr:hypothetical protein L596_002203 [Steinernema carpocapsae]
MASFDMKNSYHHVEIRSQERRLMGVSWREMFYVFNVLPFGLSGAPVLFTKLFLLEHVQRVRADLAVAEIVTSPEKCQWDPV